MTIVVGIEHDLGVTIAGDRQGSSGSYARARHDVKVWRVTSGLAIGGWGDYRLLQLLRHVAKIPAPPQGRIDTDPGLVERWLVTQLIPVVRRTLREGGALKTEHGLEQMTGEEGAGFLLGVRGQLWEVYSDLQVARSTDAPYTAGGSGARYALGALGAMIGTELKPDPGAKVGSRFDVVGRTAEAAIEIAGRFDPNVGGPTDIVHTDR